MFRLSVASNHSARYSRGFRCGISRRNILTGKNRPRRWRIKGGIYHSDLYTRVLKGELARKNEGKRRGGGGRRSSRAFRHGKQETGLRAPSTLLLGAKSQEKCRRGRISVPSVCSSLRNAQGGRARTMVKRFDGSRPRCDFTCCRGANYDRNARYSARKSACPAWESLEDRPLRSIVERAKEEP